MAKEIKFSVTIPAYKDRYLKETIDSVLAQTYQNYEIVIVNDASPYDLDSIVMQYHDPRIHYFKNEKNCGAKNVVDNWNICLSHATGDFVMCIGDDDRLTPRCLQDFVILIDKYPHLDLFHTRSDIIDDNSNYIMTQEMRPEWESVYSLMYNPRNSHLGDWLFRTETLRKNGGFYFLPYGWQSDDISAFIAAASHGVANNNEAGFQYRGNALSISHDLTCIEDKIEAVRAATEWRISFVSNMQPDNEDDKQLIDLIKQNAIEYECKEIDFMIEFDIRKKFWKRCPFWLCHHHKHGISLKRYFRCVLKAVKHSFKKNKRKKRILDVGYGKVALVADYNKGNMSSRHFYGGIELEKNDKYDVKFISLDSKQNIIGAIHNNIMLLKGADIVYITYLFTTPLFLLSILKHLKLSNKKIIAICHTTMKQGYGKISRMIYKIVYSSIDIVFFHSIKNMEESISNMSINSPQARFLYWGDNLDYIDKNYPNHTIGNFFISTGREQRDYQSLISAFKDTNIPLEIYTNRINYENHYDFLDSSKDKYNNIQIDFVERTNESTIKLAKRTSECLCVVIPLKKDHINYCLGLTSIVEAMAMRKPIITTYNPYSPIDVEKEGIGLVVKDNLTWKEAVNYIYTHREEARKMGLKGRALAEKLYNIKKCTEQVEAVINNEDTC